MATVVDELIVQLKLDPKQFNEGSKDAVSKLRQFEREHERHANKLGKDTDGLTQAFTLLQGRLLAIAGLFMGGMGIQQFTEHITRLTAQTGYLATSLGLSTSELTKWQGVGATVGASAGGIAAAVASVRQGYADLQLGKPSPMMAFSYMTRGHGQGPAVPMTGDPNEWLVGVSRWMEHQKDKNFASRTVQSMLGYDQGTINMLMLGPQELQKRLKEMEKYAPTPEQVKHFQDLQAAMAKTAMAAEKLGRELVDRMAPALTKIFDTITDFLGKVNKAREEGPAKTALEPMGKGFIGAYEWYAHPLEGMKGLIQKGRNWWNGTPETAPSAPATPGATGGWSPSGGGASGGWSGAPAGSSGGSTAPAKVGRTGWWTPERKQYAVDYLMKNGGLPEVGARALVARWAGVESTQRGASEVNYIGAEGIAQWLGNRKGGYRLGDFDSQLAHVVRELNTTERRAGHTLRSATDDRTAAIGASQYERAEGYNALTGIDNFTGKTMRAMRDIPGASPAAAPQSDGQKRVRDLHGGLLAPGDAAKFFSGTSFTNLPSMARNGNVRSSVTNSSTSTSSQTNIDNMNVTVPAGADPAAYAHGIHQELQRYDSVMQSNQGLL